jgi:NAD+-dependent protein deacetylase sirtuin 6
LEQAFPTYAHYAICELIKQGLVKHVVSTNCDGLHRRSGIERENLSELHGNAYKEDCIKCENEHFRDFDVTSTVEEPWTHLTGRHCDNCKGMLRDTVVAFGEMLPVKELTKAVSHSEKAELTIVLGSSMRVAPACNLPFKNKKSKNVIVNLQITPCRILFKFNTLPS